MPTENVMPFYGTLYDEIHAFLHLIGTTVREERGLLHSLREGKGGEGERGTDRGEGRGERGTDRGEERGEGGTERGERKGE